MEWAGKKYPQTNGQEDLKRLKHPRKASVLAVRWVTDLLLHLPNSEVSDKAHALQVPVFLCADIVSLVSFSRVLCKVDPAKLGELGVRF